MQTACWFGDQCFGWVVRRRCYTTPCLTYAFWTLRRKVLTLVHPSVWSRFQKNVVIEDAAVTEFGNRECVNTLQYGFPFLSSGRSFINDIEFSCFIDTRGSQIRVRNVLHTCDTRGRFFPRKVLGPDTLPLTEIELGLLNAFNAYV